MFIIHFRVTLLKRILITFFLRQIGYICSELITQLPRNAAFTLTKMICLMRIDLQLNEY